MHVKPTGYKSIARWKQVVQFEIQQLEKALVTRVFAGKRMNAGDRAFCEKELASYRSFLDDINSGTCR